MAIYQQAFSSFSVTDLQKAKGFFEDILELSVEELDMGFIQLDLDGTRVVVYPKDDHSPASFTVLNFVVDDVEKAVDTLTAKGVSFEHYEGFSMDEKNIARGEGPAIAWFKDPFGNIMSVLEGP